MGRAPFFNNLLMASITWTERLSVNVAEIDQQHQKLLALLGELGDALSVGKGHAVLGGITNDLAAYAATHFHTEEEYFVRFGYPDADKHKREHAFFVKKVSDFRRELENGKASLSTDVAQFLSDWLKQHIMGTDKKYGPFFNEHGLK